MHTYTTASREKDTETISTLPGPNWAISTAQHAHMEGKEGQGLGAESDSPRGSMH